MATKETERKKNPRQRTLVTRSKFKTKTINEHKNNKTLIEQLLCILYHTKSFFLPLSLSLSLYIHTHTYTRGCGRERDVCICLCGYVYMCIWGVYKMCVWLPVEARGQCQMSPSAIPTLLFEIRSPSESRAHILV